MENILFHGSDKVVERPSKKGGRLHNDFGQGFYCTPSLEMAKEWACTEAPSAFVNHYSFEPSYDLKVCDLSGPCYHVLNWLAILLNNRVFDTKQDLPSAIKEFILQEFLPQTSQFDIVRGYRADDSYFGFAQLFLNNTINLEQLSRALRLGNLGEQVFLQSEKAFEALVFMTAEPVDISVYYPRRQKRDVQAKEALYRMKLEAPAPDGIYAIDIYRNKWKNDDPRLR